MTLDVSSGTKELDVFWHEKARREHPWGKNTSHEEQSRCLSSCCSDSHVLHLCSTGIAMVKPPLIVHDLSECEP